MRPSLVLAVALLVGAVLVTTSARSTDQDVVDGVEPIMVQAPAQPVAPPEPPAAREPAGVVAPPPALDDDDDDDESDRTDSSGGDGDGPGDD